jgi:hypothetical protein
VESNSGDYEEDIWTGRATSAFEELAAGVPFFVVGKKEERTLECIVVEFLGSFGSEESGERRESVRHRENFLMV